MGQSKKDLRMHLIIMHSDLEVTKWGMSRLFLKLQEGLIDVKTFREITSKILKEGKIDTGPGPRMQAKNTQAAL